MLCPPVRGHKLWPCRDKVSGVGSWGATQATELARFALRMATQVVDVFKPHLLWCLQSLLKAQVTAPSWVSVPDMRRSETSLLEIQPDEEALENCTLKMNTDWSRAETSKVALHIWWTPGPGELAYSQTRTSANMDTKEPAKAFWPARQTWQERKPGGRCTCTRRGTHVSVTVTNTCAGDN